MPKNQYDNKRIRPLTASEREFVLAYIANGGNATQAALSAYTCSSTQSGSVMGSRLLRSPHIHAAVEAAMNQSGYPIVKVIQKLCDRVNREPTLMRQLKGYEMLFKLLGL
jgi:phage terminase small subunit